MQKVPQIGSVKLDRGVDVGANTCIDRSTLGYTRIGADTKLDNLVQIGHNVSLGEQCLIISQVGIAGSTKVGDRVIMAGQAGIAGHLTIGDDVTIGPQAGVPKNIASGVSGSGTPFIEGRNYMRSTVLIPRLPELYRRIQQLENELKTLRESLEATTGSTDGQGRENP
jgi:UDP-3-O-[3-hydroxymyristoyl] glucosamine N-acyltransferase